MGGSSYRTTGEEYRHTALPDSRGTRRALYWATPAIGSNTGSFPPDEIAIRLHHRLVSIHPFANGNGRHGRLMAYRRSSKETKTCLCLPGRQQPLCNMEIFGTAI